MALFLFSTTFPASLFSEDIQGLSAIRWTSDWLCCVLQMAAQTLWVVPNWGQDAVRSDKIPELRSDLLL